MIWMRPVGRSFMASAATLASRTSCDQLSCGRCCAYSVSRRARCGRTRARREITRGKAIAALISSQLGVPIVMRGRRKPANRQKSFPCGRQKARKPAICRFAGNEQMSESHDESDLGLEANGGARQQAGEMYDIRR